LNKGGYQVKSLSELILPDELSYTEDHEWARTGDETMTVGISDYAQDQLGDVVFVELPQVGDTFEKGEEFGTVESVKAVSELYMPVGGKITAINTALDESPGLVNAQPYEDGWMVEIKPENQSELEALMPKTAYMEILKGIE